VSNLLQWLSTAFDVVAVLLLLSLWRSYRKAAHVAPHMYLFTLVCSVLFLGMYLALMPRGEWTLHAPYIGPAAAIGFLWGLASARGMVLYRQGDQHFLRGSTWVPVWATLNLAGGKLLEWYGPGLWGVGGLVVMFVSTMATVGANLLLVVTLLRVARFYAGAPRPGGKLHFCYKCGIGY
jgi:hypothetical protein